MQKLQFIATISQTSNEMDAIAVQKVFKNDIGEVTFERTDNGRFHLKCEAGIFDESNTFLTVIPNNFQKVYVEGATNSPISFEFHTINEKGFQEDGLLMNTYFQLDVWVED